jgi:hypothetical protein
MPWPLLPPGFVVTSTAKTEHFIRVNGQPDTLR